MSDLKPMQLARVRPLLASESFDGVYSGNDADWDGGGYAGEASVNDQWKQPCRVATTATVTISTALNSGDTLDGVTLAAGDRVLVKDQGTPSQNGIYIVGTTPERAADFDDDDEVLGALVYVIAGTTNTATAWKVTNTAAVTVGSTSIVFAAFGSGGSTSFGTPANTYGTPAAGAASTAIRTDAVLPGPPIVILTLTNKSGGGVVAGDVVKIDTANDTAFTTTTTGQAEVSVGIAQATIASNASGAVLVSGYAALVNVPASVTRGHYVETYTVVKQATGNSSRRAGSFGQFLTGGTSPSAWLWGSTDQTATGGGATITTKDEGSTLSSTVTTLDFVGAGVTASGAGATTTITISGSSASYPGSVEGLYQHFKADAITGLANGASMTEWRNSAPITPGFDLFVMTGSPTYQTSVVNSLPVVRLGGATYFGLLSDALYAPTFAFVIVCKFSSLSPSYTGILGANIGADRGGYFAKSNGKTAVYPMSATSYDGTGAATVDTTNWNYLVYNGKGLTYDTRRNGSADKTGTAFTYSAPASPTFYLGNQFVGSRIMSGDIAEVLIYSRALSSADVTAVESYITGKYAI